MKKRSLLFHTLFVVSILFAPFSVVSVYSAARRSSGPSDFAYPESPTVQLLITRAPHIFIKNQVVDEMKEWNRIVTFLRDKLPEYFDGADISTLLENVATEEYRGLVRNQLISELATVKAYFVSNGINPAFIAPSETDETASDKNKTICDKIVNLHKIINLKSESSFDKLIEIVYMVSILMRSLFEDGSFSQRPQKKDISKQFITNINVIMFSLDAAADASSARSTPVDFNSASHARMARSQTPLNEAVERLAYKTSMKYLCNMMKKLVLLFNHLKEEETQKTPENAMEVESDFSTPPEARNTQTAVLLGLSFVRMFVNVLSTAMATYEHEESYLDSETTDHTLSQMSSTASLRTMGSFQSNDGLAMFPLKPTARRPRQRPLKRGQQHESAPELLDKRARKRQGRFSVEGRKGRRNDDDETVEMVLNSPRRWKSTGNLHAPRE